MSFFKLAMIVWLKIYAKGKIFDKIFLKLSETLLQYVVCNQGTNGGSRLFGGGDIQQNKKLLGLQRAPLPPSPLTHTHIHTQSPKFLPLLGYPNLPIRKTVRRVLGLLTR